MERSCNNRATVYYGRCVYACPVFVIGRLVESGGGGWRGGGGLGGGCECVSGEEPSVLGGGGDWGSVCVRWITTATVHRHAHMSHPSMSEEQTNNRMYIHHPLLPPYIHPSQVQIPVLLRHHHRRQARRTHRHGNPRRRRTEDCGELSRFVHR